jgi:hypothetical protein
VHGNSSATLVPAKTRRYPLPSSKPHLTVRWCEKLADVLVPTDSVRMRIAPEFVTTRSSSIESDGTSDPCARMMIGTRRTIPSRSGKIEKTPCPAAACSIAGDVAEQSRERHEKGSGVRPFDSEAGLQRGLALRSRHRSCRAHLTDHHARALDRFRQDLVVARQAAQLIAGDVVKIAEARRRM